MDITDKQLERINQLVAMAWPRGETTPEAENAWRALRTYVEREGICGTDVKFVRYDHDPAQDVPEPPPFAPPPPPSDSNDPAAQEQYFAELLAAFQQQRAEEDHAHEEEMAERERRVDLRIEAKWREFDARMRKSREELAKDTGGPAPVKDKSAEEIVADIMRQRRQRR